MKVIYIVIGIAVVLWLISVKSNRGVPQFKEKAQHPTKASGNMENVQQLVNKGQKIAAIKLYRQIHGVGLKQAKDAVEKLESQER